MNARVIQQAREVCEIEAAGILAVSRQIGDVFAEAVGRIIRCQGRVIVCGVGKSGIIGRKISATLASTGTPSFFLHPVEAFHGDLGILKSDDIIILISYSGETEEVLRLVPSFKSNGNVLIALTGNLASTLGATCDYALDAGVPGEACPLQVAPTSSTTAALALGDAIAMVLMKERGFREEDFAKFHPGGTLGRRLLMNVEDAMSREDLPIISLSTIIRDVIPVMTSCRKGLSVVVDDARRVVGIITDGDLRRALGGHGNVLDLTAEQVMTRAPKTIDGKTKLYAAERILTESKINALLICDETQKLSGIFAFHNL